MKVTYYFIITLVMVLPLLLFLEWIEVTPKGYHAYEVFKQFSLDTYRFLGDLISDLDFYEKFKKLL